MRSDKDKELRDRARGIVSDMLLDRGKGLLSDPFVAGFAMAAIRYNHEDLSTEHQWQVFGMVWEYLNRGK